MPALLTPIDHQALIAATFPSLGRISAFDEISGGWDSYTYLVNRVWIFQFPRPLSPPGWFAGQMRLLRGLKGKLPLAVPDLQYISDAPLCMGYRRIDGMRAANELDGSWPEELGAFLRCLHSLDCNLLNLPLSDTSAWRQINGELIEEFQRRVVPLLSKEERGFAEAIFESFQADPAWREIPQVLVHRDLGPDHVLVSREGRMAGVIDWGDARLGDPAIDFAWLLFGLPSRGERALTAYGDVPDTGFRRRARFYHQLGPWHEVAHGLDTGQPDVVASGLAGVRARLPMRD